MATSTTLVGVLKDQATGLSFNVTLTSVAVLLPPPPPPVKRNPFSASFSPAFGA